MTPQPVTATPKATLAYVLHLLNRNNLNCLPVTEGRKLVGIITRTDIIRVEAERLSGNTDWTGPKPEPSYVVYQTCSPATGKGRLLVPLSHPDTAPTLVKMAAAIAKKRDYELECLQVILVSRGCTPSETPVQTTTSRRILTQAVRLGESLEIPVHAQIRVAHDVAGAILETVKERHIDLLLMGWKGSTSTPGRVFSQVVDTVIRQAGCDVVLAKLNEKRMFNRWLVTMAGGPNSRQALQLLPALASLSSSPEIKLCQVFQANESSPDTAVLDKSLRFLKPRVKGKVVATPVCANSVVDAVVEYAQEEHSDVIVLGASREGLLQQTFKGNIPEAISRESDCTVILVRSARD